MIITLIVIIALLFIYRKYKEEDEDLLGFKVIGYYLLGAFRLNINNLALPVGFIIYFSFFKPKTNSIVKKYSAVLGLIVFFIGILKPFVSDIILERTRDVMISSTNVYDINFKNDYNLIKKKLKIEGNPKLEDFEIEFRKDGEIESLEYTLIEKRNKDFLIYRVLLSPDKSMYKIKPVKSSQWLQYNRLIDIKHFLNVIETLDFINMIPEEGHYSYVIRCSGEAMAIDPGIKGWKSYLIEGKNIKKLRNEGIPVKGYAFWVFGCDRNSKSNYKNLDNRVYIFK